MLNTDNSLRRMVWYGTYKCTLSIRIDRTSSLRTLDGNIVRAPYIEVLPINFQVHLASSVSITR
jgi:hypothetical protein